MYLMDRIGQIGRAALLNAGSIYDLLGEEGKSRILRKDYLDYLESSSKGPQDRELAAIQVKAGDYSGKSILADIESEVAIANVLRVAGLPITIDSEELRTTIFGKGDEFLAVLDGLDGTSEYLKQGPNFGRQGIMLGIFEGNDPRYGDYIFSGVLEPATKRLFHATKGQGAFVRDLVSGVETKIESASSDERTYFLADTNFDSWAGILCIGPATKRLIQRGHEQIPHFASSQSYIGVINNEVPFSLECTRGSKKRNLEPAAAFGLVSEANGVICTQDGNEIRGMKYKEFGHGEGDHQLLLTSHNMGTAEKILNLLKS